VAMTSKPILVGCDGSDSSDAALGWALDAARMRGTSVRVMHAEQPFLAPWPASPDADRTGRRSLRDFTRQELGRNA
jgi:nucleotide-binding universal stress UspA family protein